MLNHYMVWIIMLGWYYKCWYTKFVINMVWISFNVLKREVICGLWAIKTLLASQILWSVFESTVYPCSQMGQKFTCWSFSLIINRSSTYHRKLPVPSYISQIHPAIFLSNYLAEKNDRFSVGNIGKAFH